MTAPAKARKRLRQLRQMENALAAKAAIREDLGEPATGLHARRRLVTWAFCELCDRFDVNPKDIDRAIADFTITGMCPDHYPATPGARA
jgi:hypothetical protein